jgi:hypothetical protein
MHIIDTTTNGAIMIGDKAQGHADLDGDVVKMSFLGNPLAYVHPNRFPKLLDGNLVIILGTDYNVDYNLTIVVEATFKMNGTHYKRFIITKTPTDIVPSDQSIATPCMTTWPTGKLASTACLTKEGALMAVETYEFGDTGTIRTPAGSILMTNVRGTMRAVDIQLNYGNTYFGLKTLARRVHSGHVDYDFALDTAVYNKVVEQFFKATTITQEVIADAMLVCSQKIANPNYIRFLIPVMISALRTAFATEVRLADLRKSALVTQLNNLKQQGVTIIDNDISIFARIIYFFFGQTYDINQVSDSSSTDDISEPTTQVKSMDFCHRA